MTNKGTSLKEEYDTFNEKINHKSAGKLKQKLFSDFSVINQPFYLQLEFTRNSLNIAPHIWDKYNNETKGRLVATKIIENKIETLRRFYDEMRMEANRPPPKRKNK